VLLLITFITTLGGSKTVFDNWAKFGDLLMEKKNYRLERALTLSFSQFIKKTGKYYSPLIQNSISNCSLLQTKQLSVFFFPDCPIA
jgi:hypothetical protein